MTLDAADDFGAGELQRVVQRAVRDDQVSGLQGSTVTFMKLSPPASHHALACDQVFPGVPRLPQDTDGGDRPKLMFLGRSQEVVEDPLCRFLIVLLRSPKMAAKECVDSPVKRSPIFSVPIPPTPAPCAAPPREG